MSTNTAPLPAQRIRLETTVVQQVVMKVSTGRFLDEVNGLLLDGWRVVPGTFSCSTSRVLANARDPEEYIDRDGCCWKQTLFVVLEMDEVNHNH